MRALIILFLFISSLSGYSQVIKYSDLNTLFKTGRYTDAEPFLRQYLKDTKNNPSANLYMGRIFEEKLTSSSDQTRISQNVDSALYYYTLAINKLTQKEINKNAEYYSQYSRRDMKTGKFAVKLSDIQLDIETRSQNLLTLKRAVGLPIFQELTKNHSTENTQVADTPTKRKSDGKYYALIIGISIYDSTYLNLDRPIKDALELKNVITKNYEFEDSDVYTLLNPTRQQIILTLFSFRKKVTSIDNLFIFFAGHGYWDGDANQGYWWPRDASPANPSNWLSNSDIREQIRGIKTLHTLLISDACFSGGIFKVRGASSIREAPLDIISLYKLPSRRAITSGTLTEVPDRSVFFEYLLKRLRDNQDQFITSQSLFDSFKKAVINNSSIVPQDGVIADTGDEGGDFIFVRKKK